MHGAYELEPGPSREALAIDMPGIGPVEPCRLTFGEMNAGQIASVPLRAAVNALPEVVKGEGVKTAVHVDDVARGDMTWQGNCLAWENYLQMCEDNNFGLNPSKTYLGYSPVDFWGFTASLKGTCLADKNLNPIERVVEPTNLSELRYTLGVFVQSKGYVDEHAMIVEPLHALTRHGANKLPVPYVWGPAQQKAYDFVRGILLSGAHLSPADYRLPFYSGGDVSNDGKSYGIWQFWPTDDISPIDSSGNELTKATAFTVISHGSHHTVIAFGDPPTEYSIPHTDETKRIMRYFSKCWSEASRKRAPCYLEGDALLSGLEWHRFWALSSPFPLYTNSDHQPLKWMIKSEKGDRTVPC